MSPRTVGENPGADNPAFAEEIPQARMGPSPALPVAELSVERPVDHGHVDDGLAEET